MRNIKDINEIKYWNYRLIRQDHDGWFSWSIHECYFDKDDKILFISRDPIKVEVTAERSDDEARKQIIEDLKRMISAAKKSPILDYDKAIGAKDGD